MPTNDLSVIVEGDRAVVRLRGEHEAYSADRLAHHLDSLLAEGLSVAVDLGGTEFIDSTVVGVLLAGRHRAKERRLGFTLVVGERTGWPVQRLLEQPGSEVPEREVDRGQGHARDARPADVAHRPDHRDPGGAWRAGVAA